MNQLTAIQIAVSLFYVLNVKHFYCDYVIRGEFIERKSNALRWFLPMLAHTVLHGLLTFALVWFVSNVRFGTAAFLFDAATHFIIDRLKTTAGANLNLSNTALQIADQVLHEANYILIVIFVAVGLANK